MRVLLVEDDPAHAELVLDAFEDVAPDARVAWVRSVAASREVMLGETFDVLLLDVNLPDGSCLDVLADPNRRGCPSIVLTALGDVNHAVRAMKAGALDYLEKSSSTFDALPKVARATAREGAAMVRLEQAERRMRHADRLIGAGQLAALTAHEVGTPLNVVRMGLQEFAAGVDPEVAEQSAKLIHQVDLVSQRLRGMLDYSRAPRPRRRVVPLLGTARRAVELVGPLLRRQGVAVEVVGSEAYVNADAEQIQQVVFNLLSNAVQAGAKSLQISGELVDVMAQMRVTDDGSGLPSGAEDRLFDAFFTTKEVGEGTGLGLAVCSQIAAEHGGRLEWVPSDQGAVFVLTLPVA